eukprot:m.132995 g.132995  ORF g.132995 m.132995 type:complete len:460 (-) comp15791_c0_seq2:572-1951(-)
MNTTIADATTIAVSSTAKASTSMRTEAPTVIPTASSSTISTISSSTTFNTTMLTTTSASETTDGTDYDSTDVGFGPLAGSGLSYSNQIMLLGLLGMLAAMIFIGLVFYCIRRRQQGEMIKATNKVVAARCDPTKRRGTQTKSVINYPLLPTPDSQKKTRTVDTSYMRILVEHHKGDSSEDESDSHSSQHEETPDKDGTNDSTVLTERSVKDPPPYEQTVVDAPPFDREFIIYAKENPYAQSTPSSHTGQHPRVIQPHPESMPTPPPPHSFSAPASRGLALADNLQEEAEGRSRTADSTAERTGSQRSVQSTSSLRATQSAPGTNFVPSLIPFHQRSVGRRADAPAGERVIEPRLRPAHWKSYRPSSLNLGNVDGRSDAGSSVAPPLLTDFHSTLSSRVDMLVDRVNTNNAEVDSEELEATSRTNTGNSLKMFTQVVRSLRRKADIDWSKQLEFDSFTDV